MKPRRCNTCGHEWPPDSGGPCDRASLDVLLGAIRSGDQRAVVNGWLRQGNEAGRAWDPRHHPDVRHYEITRTALALARATDGSDEAARLLLTTAGLEVQPATPVGAALAALDVPTAKRCTALCDAFGVSLGLRYDAGGQAHLEGDIDGVLGRAA